MWRRPRGWRWPVPSARPQDPLGRARTGSARRWSPRQRGHPEASRAAAASDPERPPLLPPFPDLARSPEQPDGRGAPPAKAGPVGAKVGIFFFAIVLINAVDSCTLKLGGGCLFNGDSGRRCPTARGSAGRRRCPRRIRSLPPAASAGFRRRGARRPGSRVSGLARAGGAAGVLLSARVALHTPAQQEPGSLRARELRRGERRGLCSSSRSGAGRGALGSPGSSVGPRPVPARFDRGRGLGAGERPGAVGGPR